MKYISILGSTGSIGIQALQVINDFNSNFKVVGLSAKSNVDLIEKQIEQFKPEIVALEDESSANALRNRIKNQVEILSGQDGIIKVATFPKTDIVLSSIVGIAGLIPTLEAIKAGKDIALANKEVLVTSGSLVMKTARQAGVNVLPVDSEHNAILTASGGPFRDKTRDELKKVSPEQALDHPTWKMGKKITIDSATLMNKGLEVIEARWLFDVDVPKIDVIIHPQSIVHSLVEFTDGSILAQLGITDMRLSIQFALTYPQRIQSILPRLDLSKVGKLTFQDVDMEKFPCLKYAYEAIRLGGTMPTVLSGADEVAVEAFLSGKIGFLDISGIIENAMNVYKENGFSSSEPSLDDIISADRWARNYATKIINSF
jgi:1-deoxy-D-xylulose-5-phosphate reductoisomerase